MTSPSSVVLRVDRDLLDKDFESYRLVNNACPTWDTDLPPSTVIPIGQFKAGDQQFSYTHARLVGDMTNLILQRDHFYEEQGLAFFIGTEDGGKYYTLNRVVVDLNSPGEVHPSVVWKSPSEIRKSSGLRNGDEGQNDALVIFTPSFVFISKELLAFCDGREVSILHCDDRSAVESCSLKLVGTFNLEDIPHPLALEDAFLETTTNCLINLCLRYITDEADVTSYESDCKSQFATIIKWISFSILKGGDACDALSSVDVNQSLCAFGGHIEFISFVKDSNDGLLHLTFAGNTPYVNYHGFSPKSTEKSEAEQNTSGISQPEKPKHDSNGIDFVHEHEQRQDDIEDSKESESSETSKTDKISGDTEIFSLTNAQQLEEVDMIDENNGGGNFPFNVYKISKKDEPKNGFIVAKYTFDSSQLWLFNLRCRSSNQGDSVESVKAFCTRHDVDGVVWSYSLSDSPSFRHASTFDALGYVQASKRCRRCTVSPPDCSYAVIYDCFRHIYVYMKPSPLDSGLNLRNRVSGKNVRMVSNQAVISLKDTTSEEQTVGVVAFESGVILALTTSRLFVISLK